MGSSTCLHHEDLFVSCSLDVQGGRYHSSGIEESISCDGRVWRGNLTFEGGASKAVFEADSNEASALAPLSTTSNQSVPDSETAVPALQRLRPVQHNLDDVNSDLHERSHAW
jgi:hypothetical protein